MFGASRVAGALALALAGLLAFATVTAAADEWTLPPSPEEDTPPPLLEVTTTSHYEPEIPSEPGKTVLHIKATIEWNVTVTVSAHGTTVPVYESGVSDSVVKEGGELTTGPTAMRESVVPWSCKQPGTVYSYVISAGYGAEQTLTKSGSFAGASRRQCQEVRRLAVRRRREEVREQRAEARRKLSEELARQRLYEANCHKVGGKPVTIQTNEGPEIVCRSQTGGIVEA